MKKIYLLFLATSALIGSAVALHAGQPIAVSVNITGDNNGIGQWGGGFDTAAATCLLTNEQAGAPGFAQTNWNNVARFGDESSGFVDYSGAASGFHISWDCNSTYSTGAYSSLGTPDAKLMDGLDADGWNGGPPFAPLTAGAIYGATDNQKPLVYVGGIQAWLAAKGAGSYSVVLYSQGWHGTGGVTEQWVQSVTSGNPSWWNMVAGSDVTPHIFSQDSGVFNGTYTQIAPTSINLANAATVGNYVVFNGLTNDAILLRTQEPTGNYQAGKLFGFQIVATPPTPITTVPAVSPNPAYALSPVTLTELASSQSPVLLYQWQTDGGSGGSLTNIPGATASTVIVAPADQGTSYAINYACVVSNSFGAVTSLVAVLNVNAAAAPFLTRDTTPANIYAFVGGTVTFDAAFDGTQRITNRWQVDKGSGFTDLGSPAITNRDLVLSNLQPADGGSYRFSATNVLGTLSSSPATLTVQADPAAPTLSQAYAHDVLSKSPLAYWRLNEVVDPNSATYQAYDASGHGLNAIYGSGVTTGNAGPQAPSFVGFETTNTAAGFVQGTPNGTLVVPPLNLSSANVTITAWIYPMSPSPANGGLLMNRSPQSLAGLGFGSTVSPYTVQAELGYQWNNAAAARNFHSGLFAPQYVWSFVALTITPTNAVLYLCYYDGATTNVFRTNNVAPNSLETFSTGTTWLGGSPTANNSIFYGSIDDVAVFDSALSDDQVLNLFFTAQGGGVAPTITQEPSSVSTFAGQTVALSAYGVGYPAAGSQWQRGSGGVFHDVANDSHISGANSGTLLINTTVADAMDYRLVLTNANGSATSSVVTVSLTPIPLNGLWTVNYAIIAQGNGAPTTVYSGPGVLGNGTYWNALTGGEFANTTTFCDDGITPSGINFQCTNGIGSWSTGSTMHNTLLDPYANVYNSSGVAQSSAFVFTNVPNGTYNVAVFGINGYYSTGGSRGSTYTVNGVSQTLANTQDYVFALGDNTALFANVVVSNGSLLLNVDPYPVDGSEWDFNGVQLQAVSIDPITVTPFISGGNLSLSWPNYGTLMSATNVVGPWAPEAGAGSPFHVNPTNAAKFFRIRVP